MFAKRELKCGGGDVCVWAKYVSPTGGGGGGESIIIYITLKGMYISTKNIFY